MNLFISIQLHVDFFNNKNKQIQFCDRVSFFVTLNDVNCR